MKRKLTRLGYDVAEGIFSPHHFCIPQIRERAYIVGSLEGLDYFRWPDKKTGVQTSITYALDKCPPDAKPLSQDGIAVIEAWQEFVGQFPKDQQLPSFPIWSMEFGADYPYDEETPYSIGARQLAKYHGTHGQALRGLSPGARWLALPPYAREKKKRFPKWKVKFIRQNREFYQNNKKWIDRWLPNIKDFHPSRQKLEWNCKGEERDIWRYVIQFRASGVRVKRPTTSPSLIAMTTTQVPIIAWERRYMTPRECARLQSLDALPMLPASAAQAFKALGNAVNADVVEVIATALLNAGEPCKGRATRTGVGEFIAAV